jgi:outer membrane autotransporter protein
MFEDMWQARVEEIQDLCCDTCEPNKPAAPANAQKCKGTERSNWWIKGFDNAARQRDKETISGYKSKAVGVMIAYDVPINSETRAGVGGGYANTRIDGNNIDGNTDIDSYQLTGYISHKPGPVFVQGAVTAGIDKYSGARSIAFPGVSRTANADFTGQQFTALFSTGRHFYFGQNTLTPLASLQASRIHVDSYTETGAGDVNLRVNSQSYNFVQSSLGIKAERLMQSANGSYAPEVHAKWLHDFTSTTMQQTTTFSGGTIPFVTQGVAQDRELFNVGAGLTFLSCKCGEKTWTAKALYDYKWNQSNYSAHQVSLIVSTKF